MWGTFPLFTPVSSAILATRKWATTKSRPHPTASLLGTFGVWQPDPDGTGHSAEVKYTYRVLRPLTAYFLKSHQQQKFSIFNCCHAGGRA